MTMVFGPAPSMCRSTSGRSRQPWVDCHPPLCRPSAGRASGRIMASMSSKHGLEDIVQAEGESSSAFFERLRPAFLDWVPPTEEEKARELRARWLAREAELQRVIALEKAKEAEKAALRKRREDAYERAKALSSVDPLNA